MKKILCNLILFPLSFPFVSRSWGWITRRRHPRFLIKRVITKFAAHHGIKMEEFTGSEGDYTSLSDFFLRPLDQEKRPFKTSPDFFLSPSDGFVQQYEPITGGRSTQIKGIDYSVSELINKELDFSKEWFITTIYLSPSDYHRYHYPVSAKISGYSHLSGRLYPVNNLGIRYIKRLFIKNERVVVEFDMEGNVFYFVAVGASFVGSIKMEFIDKIKRDNQWHQPDKAIKQLDEMGCFQMGSTIVLVTPRTLASPIENVSGQKIKTGDSLLKLNL